MLTTTCMVMIFLVIFMLLASLIYMIYAAIKKKCPFKPKRKQSSKLTSAEILTSADMDGNQSFSTAGGIGVAIIFILVIGLIIVAIYFSIKLSMKRYELAGDALKHGHAGVAAAALAPEIGTGIGDAIGGITGGMNNN